MGFVTDEVQCAHCGLLDSMLVDMGGGRTARRTFFMCTRCGGRLVPIETPRSTAKPTPPAPGETYRRPLPLEDDLVVPDEIAQLDQPPPPTLTAQDKRQLRREERQDLRRRAKAGDWDAKDELDMRAKQIVFALLVVLAIIVGVFAS